MIYIPCYARSIVSIISVCYDGTRGMDMIKKRGILVIVLIVIVLVNSIFPWSAFQMVSPVEYVSEVIPRQLGANDYYNLALLHYENQDYSKALENIEQASAIYETEEQYLLQLSVHNDMHNNIGIADTLTKLLEFDSDELNYYLGRAAAYVELGETELAVFDLEYVAVRTTDNIEVYSMLGQLYQDLGDLEQSLLYAEKIYELDSSLDNLLTVMQIATNEGAYQTVINYGDDYLSEARSDEAYILVGNAYFMSAEYEKSIQLLEEVGEKDILVYKQLGYAYYNLQLFPEALIYLEKVMEYGEDEEIREIIILCEENIEISEQLNQEIQASMNEIQNQEQQIEEQQISDQQIAEIMRNKESSYESFNQKDYQSAITYILKYMESVEEEGLDYYLANCYNLNGELDKAITSYGISIDKSEEVGKCYYNRGLIYLKSENYEPAIADFGKAYEMKVNQDYAIYNQGIAYMNMSKFKESTQCFLKVVEISDNEELIKQAEDILSRYYVT